MSFSSNFGSLDNLKVLTRCGFKPRADQIRCTVAGLTPCAFAIARQLQCVWPGGVVSCVARTISAILSSEIDGLRPRPVATSPNLTRPCSANRSRQACTVDGATPTCTAIAVFARPCPASNSARARCTCRCGAVRDLLRLSRISRWLSVNGIGGVAVRMPTSYPNVLLFWRHCTRYLTARRGGQAEIGMRSAITALLGSSRTDLQRLG